MAKRAGSSKGTSGRTGHPKASSTLGKSASSTAARNKERSAAPKRAGGSKSAVASRPKAKPARKQTGTQTATVARKTARPAQAVKSAGSNHKKRAADPTPRMTPSSDAAPQLSKNHLTRKELDEFREMLVAKRRQLIGDVSNMESEAMRSNNQTGTGSSSMPIHMADLGSDTWEQELTLGLIENERGLIREIDEALSRIEDHTYGICIATGKPIAKARLRAKPWAKYCIEHARKLELGLL